MFAKGELYVDVGDKSNLMEEKADTKDKKLASLELEFMAQ